jgi:hypothetical protein
MSDPDEALQQTGDGAPTPTAFRAAPIEQLTGQVQDIQNVMDDLMQEGTHYDDVTGDGRNSLMQPGAEKLCFAFKFAPSFDVTREDYDADKVPNADEPVEGHREYTVECKLHHRPTGQYVGSGSGSCSTLESKYRYRKIDQTTEVPIPGEFWDSYEDSMANADFSILEEELTANGVDIPDGGEASVTKNDDGEWRITVKAKGENPDIADQYNTVLKMAEKRALVNAVKRSTAASDIFTQDTEDLAQLDGSDVQGQRKRRPSSGSATGSASSRSRQTKQVTRHGITVTQGQAEKIDERDDALDELDEDELAAAILAVEGEMEDWPSEALCDACDAMLDEHRRRLEAQQAEERGADEQAASSEEPAEEAEGDGTASTPDGEAHDEAFEDGAADDDLPF